MSNSAPIRRRLKIKEYDNDPTGGPDVLIENEVDIHNSMELYHYLNDFNVIYVEIIWDENSNIQLPKVLKNVPQESST